VYIPPEETVITRAGAAASRVGRKSEVSRNGPRTLVANVSSTPSGVWVRGLGKHPGVVDEEIETVEARLEALGEPPAPPRDRRGRRARA
jgi:hypothetical protein